MTNFLQDVILGKDQGLLAKSLKPFLWILCVIYTAGVAGLRTVYRKGILKSYSLSKPVISVGNITVGGTGKTPFSVYLAKKISLLGKRPVILMRGYMSRAGAVSDEEQMVRRQLTDIPVCVSPDRVGAARESLRRDGPDIFILDDGFQHWRVRRDLDIVLVDAMNPFGNGWPLPLGPLREPKSSLTRADLFVITRADLVPDRTPELCRELGRINPRAGIVEAAQVPVGIEEPWSPFGQGHAGALASVRGRVCACSAIGSPEGFAATLRNLGAEIVHHEIFRDHHVYTADDAHKVVNLCRLKKVDRVVTTEKDIVKLISFRDIFSEVRLMALAIAVKILKGENEISSRLSSVLHT